MNEEFKRNVAKHGPEGNEWLKRIPKIIVDYEKKWSLKVSAPFPNLTYNYVAPATRSEGTKTVLKIGFPGDEDFSLEIATLSAFNGDGSVKLVEKDSDNFVFLVEQIIPGKPLSSLENDEEATKILASVMKKLWKRVPATNNFPHISKWSHAIKALKVKYAKETIPNIPRYLIEKADNLFDELISTSKEELLLHGDLHQYNVLFSENSGWLAIDPEGVIAEPAYETAVMIRNPYLKMTGNKDMKKIITKRIEILSEELGFERKRILDWSFAQTILSAVWHIDDKERTWEHALEVAKVLDTLIV